MTRAMIAVRLLDIPNQRSSHVSPIASGGGIAITLTATTGFLILIFGFDTTGIPGRQLLGICLALAVIIGTGVTDDLGKFHSFKLKLLAQVTAAVILSAAGLVINQIPVPGMGAVDLGWWGYLLTVLWLVGLANAFNFMDGLDGLAGGTGVVVAISFCVIGFLHESIFVFVTSYVLAAAISGYLPFNFPKARIFMGDTGSQFIGFFFAAIALIAYANETARIPILVMPLLLFNFLFDTLFTLCRRLSAGEDITQAHRSHLYQLYNRMGYSHVAVSTFHFIVAMLQGCGALWLVSVEKQYQMAVFLPFLVFQAIYAIVIVTAVRRHNLI